MFRRSQGSTHNVYYVKNYYRPRNHPFLDGNKRTSLVVAELFLELNGSELTATDSECVTTFLRLAAGGLTEEQLGEWITLNSTPPARESA